MSIDELYNSSSCNNDCRLLKANSNCSVELAFIYISSSEENNQAVPSYIVFNPVKGIGSASTTNSVS